MPDLPKKDGRHCRVFKNKVVANNHENFAPKGNIVATVPPGTGVMIMASDEVEVFDNTIEKNQTAGLSIVSYLITDKPIKDDKYDPFCEAIYVHDNRFASNGEKPAGAIGEMLAQGRWARPCPTSSTTGWSTRRRRSTGPCPRRWRSGSATTATPISPTSTRRASGRPRRRRAGQNAEEAEHQQGSEAVRRHDQGPGAGLDRGPGSDRADATTRRSSGDERVLVSRQLASWPGSWPGRAAARRHRRPLLPPAAEASDRDRSRSSRNTASSTVTVRRSSRRKGSFPMT